MSRHIPQQRHLTIRGRLFHFVTFQGSPGNLRRAQLPYPDMWYLMADGRRCPVIPCEAGHSQAELDAALTGWAEDNALGPVEAGHLIPHGPARLSGHW